MCDICEKARLQPMEKALNTIAEEMNKHPGLTCLDDLVGELVGDTLDAYDALDEDTEALGDTL